MSLYPDVYPYMILILMSEYMTFNPGLGTIQAYLKRHLTLAGV